MPRGIVLLGLALLVSLVSCRSDPGSLPPESPSSTESVGVPEEIIGDEFGDSPYASPLSLDKFIDRVSESIVMIGCGKYFGTGWFIDTASPPYVRTGRSDALNGGSHSLLVTVDHVTRKCAKNPRRKLRVFIDGDEVPARLVNWNSKADIALLSVEGEAIGLPVGKRPPQAAWVMAIGYPLYFDYPVTLIGSVIDATGEDVVTQMQIQPGNSGSPLINSRGEVVATLKEAFRDPDENAPVGWSLGNSTQVLCRYLFKCTEVPITQRHK